MKLLKNTHDTLVLEEGYKPSYTEEYMNPQQIEYFKRKLINWKNTLLTQSRHTLNQLKEERWNEPDDHDRAAIESETGTELRTRNRYFKLIEKIDAAIFRCDTNTYGYCEETNEPIGIKRLEARPIATLSIEAQERHEQYEKNHADD